MIQLIDIVNHKQQNGKHLLFKKIQQVFNTNKSHGGFLS